MTESSIHMRDRPNFVNERNHDRFENNLKPEWDNKDFNDNKKNWFEKPQVQKSKTTDDKNLTKYQEKWNEFWKKEKNKFGKNNGRMNLPGQNAKPIRFGGKPRTFQRFQKLSDDIKIFKTPILNELQQI